MRPLTLPDLMAAARLLCARPRPCWGALMALLLAETRTAEAWRQRMGRAHPRFGNGTLAACALARCPPPAPDLADPLFLHALATVLAAVLAALSRDPPFRAPACLC
jgi:hypothetical protein